VTIPGAVPAMKLAVCRPKATRTHGTGVTLQASQPATAIAAVSARATPGGGFQALAAAGDRKRRGGRAAIPMSTRWAAAVPIAGMSSRLKSRAPAMAPTVLAA